MNKIEVPERARAAILVLADREKARRMEEERARAARAAAERERQARLREELLPAACRIVAWARGVVESTVLDVPIEVFASCEHETRHGLLLHPDGSLTWTHHYKWMRGTKRASRPGAVAAFDARFVRLLAGAIDDGTIWRHVEALARK